MQNLGQLHSQKKRVLVRTFFVLYMEPQGIEPLKWFFTIEEPKKVLEGTYKGAKQPLQNSFWFLVEPLGGSI